MNQSTQQDHYQAYDTITESRRELVQKIVFLRKNGNAEAYDYSLLYRLSFTRDKIVLYFGNEDVVTIEGINLNEAQEKRKPLFQGLTEHHVRWVKEIDVLHAKALELPKTATVISSISCEAWK